MRPASAERRERKVDRQREDQISRQDQMNLCYDSTGWNYVLNPRSDWQPVQGSEQRFCVASPSSAKDKTSCIVLYSLQAIQPVFLETRQQRNAVVPP